MTSCLVCNKDTKRTKPIDVLCEECWDLYAGGGAPPNHESFIGKDGAKKLRALADMMESVDSKKQTMANKELIAEVFVEFMTQLSALD